MVYILAPIVNLVMFLDKLLFPDLINWDLDPLINYYDRYNVSTVGRGPKWVPNFEFRTGSGSRFVSPSLQREIAPGDDLERSEDEGTVEQ